MWILVLVFKLGTAGGIISIPNFPTEISCKFAGEQWIDYSKELSQIGSNYSYKCIHAVK